MISLHVKPEARQAGSALVKIEVLNASLDPVRSEWAPASRGAEFRLDPGVYAVRVTVPSGKTIARTVKLETTERKVEIPLESLSRHADQEWADLTQRVNDRGDRLLSDDLYAGAWIRLWTKRPDGWSNPQLPVAEARQNKAEPARWADDGVTYEFALERGQHFLQLGGPKIPWKLSALPPVDRLSVLVRPAAGPRETVHPLSLVVSSHDAIAEAMLSYLTRGNTGDAIDLIDHVESAREMLLYKTMNPCAAAVGGYFLLQAGEYQRMRDWADNLQRWMNWMPDGCVIRGWQLIHEGGSRTEARELFLEAVRRGMPIYTCGLRSLIEGLRLLARKNRAEEVAALEAAETFGENADWSAPTTTFGGIDPDTPAADSLGEAAGTGTFGFVFDVPLRALFGASLQIEGPMRTALTLGQMNLETLGQTLERWGFAGRPIHDAITDRITDLRLGRARIREEADAQG